jgi:hypothetical protein
MTRDEGEFAEGRHPQPSHHPLFPQPDDGGRKRENATRHECHGNDARNQKIDEVQESLYALDPGASESDGRFDTRLDYQGFVDILSHYVDSHLCERKSALLRYEFYRGCSFRERMLEAGGEYDYYPLFCILGLSDGLTVVKVCDAEFGSILELFYESPRCGRTIIIDHAETKIDVLGPQTADSGLVFQNETEKNQQEHRQEKNPKYFLPDTEEHPRIRKQ